VAGKISIFTSVGLLLYALVVDFVQICLFMIKTIFLFRHSKALVMSFPSSLNSNFWMPVDRFVFLIFRN
jgi:hypothetical protein